jgi:hypothetical protein
VLAREFMERSVEPPPQQRPHAFYPIGGGHPVNERFCGTALADIFPRRMIHGFVPVSDAF